MNCRKVGKLPACPIIISTQPQFRSCYNNLINTNESINAQLYLAPVFFVGRVLFQLTETIHAYRTIYIGISFCQNISKTPLPWHDASFPQSYESFIHNGIDYGPLIKAKYYKISEMLRPKICNDKTFSQPYALTKLLDISNKA